MNKQLILETVRSWADNRFTDAAGKREVLERNTPPPSVDVRAGLAVAPKDSSGVFFFLQADGNKSLQVWLSSEGLGSAYTFLDDENDEEQHILHFPQPASPEELTAKLSEIVNRFMRTLIFEPALDEWVGDNGGVYEFEQISEFCGGASNFFFNFSEEAAWTFFRYTWPGRDEVEVICGFDGSGNAATFYKSNDDLDGFFDFDEKVTGVQNAEQFRAWLDKAVGRPTTMTIREVTIKNLFGNLTYRIPFKTESSATIIHAPNGCGKSTILNLVLSLLTGRFGELFHVRFDSLTLEFDGGRRLVVGQVLHAVDPEVADAEERRRRRISHKNSTSLLSEGFKNPVKNLSVELFDVKGKVLAQDEIKVERSSSRSRLYAKNAAHRIIRRSPHLREHRQGIFDSITGELLSLDEVLERYSVPETGDAKEWLSRLLARNETYLIQTKRLDAQVVFDRGAVQEEFETIPTIVQQSQEVSKMLKMKLRAHSNVSQKLDGEFLNELIKSDQVESRSHGDLQNGLSEVARKYGRVVESGILDGNSGSKITQLPERAADDPTLTKAVGLYVDNQLQKLRVFDEILQKIETLKSLVNKRFQMKRLEVSPEIGYCVISEHDNHLIPLDKLSSGEQHQLVLFHSLIFGMRPGALIMIDEPEISLHVAWQEIFLRDLELIAKSSGVHFLIATHSPHIIGNRWKQTVSLGEQIQEVV
jgi:predicted ATP-binding protein involved in virulence